MLKINEIGMRRNEYQMAANNERIMVGLISSIKKRSEFHTSLLDYVLIIP